MSQRIFTCGRHQSHLKNQDRDSSRHRLRIPGTAYRPALEHMWPPSIVSSQHRCSWLGRTTDHSAPSSAKLANKQLITGTKTSGVNIPGRNTEGLTKNAMHAISSLNGWQLLSGPRTSQLQYKQPSRRASPQYSFYIINALISHSFSVVSSVNFPNTNTHILAQWYRCHQFVQVSAQNNSILGHNRDRFQYNGPR
jgi:hypothetical protein